MKDDEGCTPLIKVAIAKHFWYKMDSKLSLFGFCCCDETLAKTISVSHEGKPRQGFNQDLRQEMKQRSWGNDAFFVAFSKACSDILYYSG